MSLFGAVEDLDAVDAASDDGPIRPLRQGQPDSVVVDGAGIHDMRLYHLWPDRRSDTTRHHCNYNAAIRHPPQHIPGPGVDARVALGILGMRAALNAGRAIHKAFTVPLDQHLHPTHTTLRRARQRWTRRTP